jgi:hypothetical protein
MTTPYERTRAVNELGNAVLKLHPYLRGKGQTARVPVALLREITGWMRHYPMSSELSMCAEKCPCIWSSAADPYRKDNHEKT